ncbi:MAG: hypothetical protein K2K17_06440 [Lachnospiraceae bacterium]|nr:hypothetical protein [Lachnospiraceae bacterium]
MKAVEYKKPVSTIPEGVWESSRPEGKDNQGQQCTQTTDLQGNGYPAAGQKSSNHGGSQKNDPPAVKQKYDH